MFNILFSNPGFLLFIISCLLAQIGAGLAQVAVYGYLGNVDASYGDFALTFVMALLPALFATTFARWLMSRVRLDVLLLGAQAVGMFATIIPLFGLYAGNIFLLQIAEFVTAGVFGFIYPIAQTYIRRSFNNEELVYAAKIDALVFSLNIFIGLGLGTLFYNLCGSMVYLLLNLAAYVVAFLILLVSSRLNTNHFDKVEAHNKQAIRINFSLFSDEQNDAFLALPALAVLGSVLMSMSPTFGIGLNAIEVPKLGITVSPILALLFARCLGQMIAPFIVPKSLFKNWADSHSFKIFTLIAFLGFYLCAYHCDGLIVKCTLVILAHIFSNIYFVLGMYAMQANFSSEQIGNVSSAQYQIQLVLMIACPVISGLLIQKMGFELTAFLFFALSVLLIKVNIFKQAIRGMSVGRGRL